MAPHDDPSPDADAQPLQDPWQAFSYIVSGVLFYGGLGWLADRWWETSYLVAVGILVGAALGIYLVLRRFGHRPGPAQQSKRRS